MTRNNCSCSDSIEAGLLRIVHTLPPCSLKAPKSPRTDGSVVAWGSPRCGGDAGAVQSQLWQVRSVVATHRAFAALCSLASSKWGTLGGVHRSVETCVCVYTASHMPF